MSRELSDWIDSYVEFTQYGESAESFRRWSAISAVAGALQRKCYLNWGMLTFYPNLYVILVGPGAARKGTAMAPARAILKAVGVKMASEASSQQALEIQMVEALENAQGPGLSVEAHCSLSVYHSEITNLIGYQNKELLSRLCQWYDCEEGFDYKTKTSGNAIIQGVFLNIFGCATPDQLQLALPLEAIGGGLTSRIIFIYEPGLAKRELLPYKDAQLEEALIRDLAKVKALSGIFKVSPEFLEAYAEWYLKSDPQPLRGPKFESYCGRRANHIFKLSMAMSASRGDSLILTVKDFTKALKTLEAAERKMEMVFAGIGKSKVADVTDKMIVYIASNKEVSLADITSLFYRDADVSTIREILQTLAAMDKIELDNTVKPMKIRFKLGK